MNMIKSYSEEFQLSIIHLTLPPFFILLLSLYYISPFFLSLHLPTPLSSTSSLLSSLSPLLSSYILPTPPLSLTSSFHQVSLPTSFPSFSFLIPPPLSISIIFVCVCFKIPEILGQKHLPESGDFPDLFGMRTVYCL